MSDFRKSDLISRAEKLLEGLAGLRKRLYMSELPFLFENASINHEAVTSIICNSDDDMKRGAALIFLIFESDSSIEAKLDILIEKALNDKCEKIRTTAIAGLGFLDVSFETKCVINEILDNIFMDINNSSVVREAAREASL